MDEKTRVTVEVELACGCWVTRCMHTVQGISAIGRSLQLVADSMPHWFDRVEGTHKCELVSVENPSGITRIT